MMNETMFKIALSALFAVTTVFFSAKAKRNKRDIFYVSATFLNGWAGCVFASGVGFFFMWVDLYNDPESGFIGLIIFLSIVWLFLFFALIYGLSKRYEIKGNILARKEFFSKAVYIDISKIASIEIIHSYESHHYQANMCDGGFY
ncbi:MAG: hypothetical protein FWC64_08620 [Treponema sp.]|nr:hypothetical protein [Treponema sp.]